MCKLFVFTACGKTRVVRDRFRWSGFVGVTGTTITSLANVTVLVRFSRGLKAKNSSNTASFSCRQTAFAVPV